MNELMRYPIGHSNLAIGTLGVKVLHILNDAFIEHPLSPYAWRESLQLIYVRHTNEELELR